MKLGHLREPMMVLAFAKKKNLPGRSCSRHMHVLCALQLAGVKLIVHWSIAHGARSPFGDAKRASVAGYRKTDDWFPKKKAEKR